MLCQNCGKNEANVHYTQIINGVKKEVILCSECAKKLGMDNIDIPINFSSFLGDFFNDYAENALLPTIDQEEVKCRTCGMTYSDFIKTGMFGCSDCYDVFSNPIDSLLKNLHGTSRHIGRTPQNINQNLEKSDKKVNKIDKKNTYEAKKNELNELLEKAIKEERYEDAAKIRDQIKEMNK